SPPAPRTAEPRARCGHQPLCLQHQTGVEGRGGPDPQGAHPRHRLRLLHPRRLRSPGGAQD
ncbi:hypothetical protein HGM15179_022405, partial [Zosterops borbonicus]